MSQIKLDKPLSGLLKTASKVQEGNVIIGLEESLMKCLTIQFNPKTDTSHTLEELVILVRSIGRYPEIDQDDETPHTNLNFFTEELEILWAQIQTKVFEDPLLGSWLKSVAIVACEGEQGWDDHLLLHHYNNNETLDKLSST